MEEEEEEAAAPPLFLCPISMELMQDPVTVSSGVTYERKNIEKWLFTYNNLTCPATMQPCNVQYQLTPNTTLFNLIQSWRRRQTPPTTMSTSPDQLDRIRSSLATINDSSGSSPFKFTHLKNLQSLIQANPQAQAHFISLGGIQVLLSKIIITHQLDHGHFSLFRSCEEALSILQRLPLSDKASVEFLSKPEHVNPMIMVLQRGSAEARLHTMTILLKLSKTSKDWMDVTADQDQTMMIKSLLELLSDEISTKLTSSALDLLIEIMSTSTSKNKKTMAIEAGAICVLVELLPDSKDDRHKCEKILYLLWRLCECSSRGRSAFVEHQLGIAAVTMKMLRVSELATKLGVKILFVVSTAAALCSTDHHQTSKVIEDMMMFGCVRKLIALLHADGRSTTKERVVKMLKMHGGVWRRYACFPTHDHFIQYLP